jgi:hypothetical protein
MIPRSRENNFLHAAFFSGAQAAEGAKAASEES